jgi:hypothetical protein
VFLRKTNRAAEAEPFFHRALTIAEVSLTPGDPRIMRLRKELASVRADLAGADPSP